MYGRHRTRHLAVAGHGSTHADAHGDDSARLRKHRSGAAQFRRTARRLEDEFDYGSGADPTVPDRAKWRLTGSDPAACWLAHASNGRRRDTNARLAGGVLLMTGETDGDTGWLASQHSQKYGRWERRVHSRATTPDDGRTYHLLLILWPDANEHPEGGKYDSLKNGAPGERCAEAFLHYPHPEDIPVQQEHTRRCRVNLAQWRNIAADWALTTCAASSTARNGFASPAARARTGTASGARR
ncbi:hypothetical protein ACIF8T_38110 [Streptomyces sp. NPDC085946]|uniref:hypothetical protein n=1 Tax=Streptomyces sp. NPDC085946 TaxID=3365744 RepID=UPI0037D4CF8A